MVNSRLKFRAATALLVVVLMTHGAAAHELQHTARQGLATIVELRYAAGPPFAFEAYEIYAQGESIPYQVGRTDGAGRISFVPDREGIWRLRSFAEDGHGLEITLEAGPGGDVHAQPQGWFDRYPRVVAGLGFLLGIFGLAALFARRRQVPLHVAIVLILSGAWAISSAPAQAHHGVASLGVAGLEGPGAAVETSSASPLPAGSVLVYTKLDFARFATYTAARDAEGDFNAFWMHGVGYGITSYLSAYVFAPFYTKKVEDNSFNTSGFADIALAATLGFTFDGALRLTPTNESLDDLEDWHFSIFAGLTLPTGNENLADANGEIDPGMSLGFGTISTMAGLSATKQLAPRLTAAGEISFITFGEHTYADGVRVRFGDELRCNLALPLRVYTDGARKMRLDLDLEGNLLSLGRDEAAGTGADGTGGAMVYLLPGLRLYCKGFSLGTGVKFPVWTDLNEADDQQGAEGKEDYRLILTLGTLL